MIDYGYSAVTLDKNIPHKAQDWRNDPEVRRWCRQTGLITEQHHNNWLKRIEDPDLDMFGIYVNQSYDAVGVCGLTGIDLVHSKAEFSLYIAPRYRGAGYASGALKTLLRYGFDELGLNIVWGEVLDPNPARALFEKLGFVKEGTLRDRYYKAGRFWDSHMISIKRSEGLW